MLTEQRHNPQIFSQLELERRRPATLLRERRTQGKGSKEGEGEDSGKELQLYALFGLLSVSEKKNKNRNERLFDETPASLRLRVILSLVPGDWRGMGRGGPPGKVPVAQ